MTLTHAPDGCPPAHGGCTCPCHRTPGMFHLVACCRQVVGPDPVPSVEVTKAMTEDQIGAAVGTPRSNLKFFIDLMERLEHVAPEIAADARTALDQLGEQIMLERDVARTERDAARADFKLALAERDALAGDYPHIGMTLNEAGVPEYYAATGQSPVHLTPHKRVKWLVGQREEYRKERDDAVAKLNDALKANQELTQYTTTAKDNGREVMERQAAMAPVPITIQCPKCAHWHVDEDKVVDISGQGLRAADDGADAGYIVQTGSRNWAKHPHSTHRCAYCQHEWQPFPIKMPTVGVAPKLTTKEEDAWSAAAAKQARELGAEIGTLKAELEKALAGPWRPDLRKELDAALTEIGVLKKERDEALQGKAHTASDCDMARRERDVALQQRDEARELCRSAKADVTTLRGLLKDLENKIQAMVQANAAGAWGIAERDKMMKECDRALRQEEIALAALLALRKEAEVFVADRDRYRNELNVSKGNPEGQCSYADLLKQCDEIQKTLLKDRRVLEGVVVDRDLARGKITELRKIIAVAQKERDERVYLKGELINAQRERDQARKEIDAMNMRGMSDPIQLLISGRDMARMERDQIREVYQTLSKEVEAENWAVLQALQQPGVTEVGTWYAMTRLQQIQALVRDRDAWRSKAERERVTDRVWDGMRDSQGEPLSPLDQVAEDSKRRHAIAEEVIAKHLERTARAGQLSSSGTVAIGVVPAVGNATGERPHPTSDRYHIVTDELAIMVHLHLAGSGWATDQDLERALKYWALERWMKPTGMTLGAAMDLLSKEVDAWAARKVRDPKGVWP